MFGGGAGGPGPVFQAHGGCLWWGCVWWGCVYQQKEVGSQWSQWQLQQTPGWRHVHYHRHEHHQHAQRVRSEAGMGLCWASSSFMLMSSLQCVMVTIVQESTVSWSSGASKR